MALPSAATFFRDVDAAPVAPTIRARTPRLTVTEPRGRRFWHRRRLVVEELSLSQEGRSRGERRERQQKRMNT